MAIRRRCPVGPEGGGEPRWSSGWAGERTDGVAGGARRGSGRAPRAAREEAAPAGIINPPPDTRNRGVRPGVVDLSPRGYAGESTDAVLGSKPALAVRSSADHD